jgi:diguanylate cyclase (GGDEF)-like protein
MKTPQCPHDHPDCSLPSDLVTFKAEIAKLRDLVTIDELTGLFNFRFLKGALEGEMERTWRTGLPTGLIMVDLDHFKQINDTHGHENGNLALSVAARIWKTHCRKIDIPCRYGGEEFVIILPNTDIRDAILVAERLRSELEAAPIELDHGRIHLTASFGVDEYCEGEELTTKGFIQRVDMYMLDAKKEGRNRICYDRRKLAQLEAEETARAHASRLKKG